METSVLAHRTHMYTCYTQSFYWLLTSQKIYHVLINSFLIINALSSMVKLILSLFLG
jgi:hypothetical protein